MKHAWLVLGVLLVVAIVTASASRPARSAPAVSNPVTVVAAGVTQIGDGMGVGIVLKNTSKGDAKKVEVTFFAETSSGAPVSAGSTTINIIPKGATFYTGDELSVLAPGRVATKVEAFVKVEETVLPAYKLPLVSNVKLVKSSSGYEVSGVLKNTLKATLGNLARIGIVVFDKGGKVLGGAYTYPDRSLPKGKSLAWHTTIPTIKGAASANASAENEGLESEPISS